jgi:hypothetical protein
MEALSGVAALDHVSDVPLDHVAVGFLKFLFFLFCDERAGRTEDLQRFDPNGWAVLRVITSIYNKAE